jgi:uncharacterized protein (TIGR02145 family)
MNKKTSYIIIFSLLVVLTVGIIFTDYIKQLGTILADASVPNPGHSLSEIEGGQDLATKSYVNTAIAGITQGSVTSVGTGDGLTGGPITSSGTISVDSTVVRTIGNQTIGGTKTFSNTIVGTGIIASASGGIRPACNASARGLMWYEYGSSGQRDKLYICQKFSNDTYAYTAVTADDITGWDCGDDFIDPRDSNIYPTVQIGTQCWMAKNLAYLPSVVGPLTGSETTPYYYVYDYNGTSVSAAKATSNYTTYGVLYNWPAAMTACPIGWHLPTDAEQYILEKYLSTGDCSPGDRGVFRCVPAGTALKEGGSAGFNAKLGGSRYADGSFLSIGSSTYFWSSSAYDSSNAWYRKLITSDPTVRRNTNDKAYGFSVRCLRD